MVGSDSEDIPLDVHDDVRQRHSSRKLVRKAAVDDKASPSVTREEQMMTTVCEAVSRRAALH